jgi:hypothetical protein
MQNLINQLVSELTSKVEYINSVMVNADSHTVDFREGTTWYWAKLSKNNSRVLKNSVRRNSYQ